MARQQLRSRTPKRPAMTPQLPSKTTQERAKIEDGDKITVIVLVLSTDFLPAGAPIPAGPIVTGKRPVHAIAVGGYAVIPLPNGSEPKIAGVLTVADEGRVWCRGWEGLNVNAMRSVNAIEDMNEAG